MATVISCVNLKGGVGKTALSVNFAAYCGLQGKRTLLVDLDPQTNATFSCMTVDNWQKHAKAKGTVADLLGVRSHANADGQKKVAADVIKKNVFKNVDLIPSHLDLFTVDLDLAGATGRERRLSKALAPVLEDYEVVVCDCPPNLTIPTQNALAASSHFVVPISPDFLSSLGVAILLNRIKKLAEDLDSDPKLAGIVVSRVGRPAHHRSVTIDSLRQAFKSDVLKTEIHERVAVSISTEKQVPIFSTSDTEAAAEFTAASVELIKRTGI